MLWLIEIFLSVGRLLDLHGESAGHGAQTEGAGERVDRPDNYEPPVQASV